MPYANDLPGVWRRPTMELQKSLFPWKMAEILARTRVSVDEAQRWFVRGWLSFDPRVRDEIDQSEWFELIFVRNIARSGLSDEQIEDWLEDLPKPYRYDSSRVAYSFAHGWVECPPDALLDDLSEGDITEWIKAQALLGDDEVLQRIRTLIFNSLVELRERATRLGDSEMLQRFQGFALGLVI